MKQASILFAGALVAWLAQASAQAVEDHAMAARAAFAMGNTAQYPITWEIKTWVWPLEPGRKNPRLVDTAMVLETQ